MANIDIDNITIYYERYGTGSPLLFLHGLGSCGADWLFQIPYFATGYEVFTPDLRGHGNSSKVGPFTIAQTAADIKTFIEKLGLGAVHLVGLSYGSFVALELTFAAPMLVKSLTLAGTTCNIGDIPPSKLWLRRVLLTCLPMQTVGKLVASSLFPLKSQAAVRRICAARLASNPKQVYRALFKDILHFNVEKRLSAIRCPTLIISGGKDKIFPPSHALKIKQNIPHARLELLPNAGHASPIDSPEEFNKLLESFLNDGARER